MLRTAGRRLLQRSTYCKPIGTRSSFACLASCLKPSVSQPSLSAPKRGYHDIGIYGSRQLPVVSFQDCISSCFPNLIYLSCLDSPEELRNRAENANLVLLVEAFQRDGHLLADLDPLQLTERPDEILSLLPERYGLTDFNKEYNLTGIVDMVDPEDNSIVTRATLETIVKHLHDTYCGKIAFEFSHCPDPIVRQWFAQKASTWQSLTSVPAYEEHQRRILQVLVRSEVFDQFMQKRFTQVKRYGLEGAESMMVALDRIFAQSTQQRIRDIVLCMPHRGRLNLLTDLMQYPAAQLFYKIKGNSEIPQGVPGTGDVLSHIASSSMIKYGDGEIHVSMLHNPSHLEAVNPVAMGKARAKQTDYIHSGQHAEDCKLGDQVMCIQLHGDAAFTGQGVVMESLGLSNLSHFSSGGSIHVIVNNQLGYTTPASNAHSSIYTSDVGKMINAPVLHVNGDYPEYVARAAEIALEYRQKFRKDIILDLITYRRWGHNELDEPGFTQPIMYEKIRSRKSVPQLYQEKLISSGVVSESDIDALRSDYFSKLDEQIKLAETYFPPNEGLENKWKGFEIPQTTLTTLDTGISKERLVETGLVSVQHPSNMVIHSRLQRYHIQAREKRIKENKPVDWATAEAMAFGTLLQDGYNVRISGQDVGRGTFSQRHAMLVCQKTEQTYVPLNAVSPIKAGHQVGKFEVVNSSLSEFAVLGFEYGMSLENPKLLPIWEAQFGDFFNTAQVIIDTFISSGEAKWLRESGLVMLLPHGYDGTGPEHSSCRMERFLQLSDDPFHVDNVDSRVNVNMHIVNPTTPAQYFHVLRRQMLREFRKPLIVVGPKTLLRLPNAVSSLDEMAEGTGWQPVLTDSSIQDASK